jgi:hypothetical protein
MSPYSNFFRSVGTCVCCNQRRSQSVTLKGGPEVFCGDCYRTNENEYSRTWYEIVKLQRREKNLLIRSCIAFGLMKSRAAELSTLRIQSGILERTLQPIHEEFDRRLFAIKAYKEKKEQVRERDNQKCQSCGRKEVGSRVPFHIHHRIYRAHGGSDDLENLVLLCEICHSKLPMHDQVKIQREKRLARERQTKSSNRGRRG